MKSFERLIYEVTVKSDPKIASDAGEGANLRDSAARRKSTDKKLEDVRKKNIVGSAQKAAEKKRKASKPAQGGKSLRTAVSGIKGVLQRNKEKAQKRIDLGGETGRKVGRAATGAFQSVFDYKPDKERTDTQQGGMGTALRNLTNVGKAALSGAIKAPAERIAKKKQTVGGRVLGNLKGRFQDAIGVEKTPRTEVGQRVTAGMGDKFKEDKKKQDRLKKEAEAARERQKAKTREKFTAMRQRAKEDAAASAARNPVRSQSNQVSRKSPDDLQTSVVNRRMISQMRKSSRKESQAGNLATQLTRQSINKANLMTRAGIANSGGRSKGGKRSEVIQNPNARQPRNITKVNARTTTKGGKPITTGQGVDKTTNSTSAVGRNMRANKTPGPGGQMTINTGVRSRRQNPLQGTPLGNSPNNNPEYTKMISMQRRRQQAYDTADDSDAGAPMTSGGPANQNLRDVYRRNNPIKNPQKAPGVITNTEKNLNKNKKKEKDPQMNESMGRIEAERTAKRDLPNQGRMRTYREIQDDKAKQEKIKKYRSASVISPNIQDSYEYSHWREEFIWETDKKYPDKIKEIKPMSGKNTITINPEDETSKYKRGY